MGRLRCLLGAFSIVGFICTSKAALAQTTAPSVTLNRLGVTHSAPHGATLLTSAINAADCNNDDVIIFPVSLSGSQGESFQVWAGTGCEEVAPRSTQDHAQCWQLDAAAATDGPRQVALSVRDILFGRTLAGDSTQGPLGQPAQLYPTLACTDRTGSGAPQTLSVYFMLVDAADNVNRGFAKWSASYKLVRPRPPNQVSVGIGEERLVVRLGYTELSDSTIVGFRVYCDPAPGGSHAVQPSATDPGVCPPSTVLVEGTDSSLVSAQRCGSADKAATYATTDSLTGGVAYAVAVTAVDDYENESVLSPVACEVPSPKQRRVAACAFSQRGELLPMLVFLSMAGLLAARRRGAFSAAIQRLR